MNNFHENISFFEVRDDWLCNDGYEFIYKAKFWEAVSVTDSASSKCIENHQNKIKK